MISVQSQLIFKQQQQTKNDLLRNPQKSLFSLPRETILPGCRPRVETTSACHLPLPTLRLSHLSGLKEVSRLLFSRQALQSSQKATQLEVTTHRYIIKGLLTPVISQHRLNAPALPGLLARDYKSSTNFQNKGNHAEDQEVAIKLSLQIKFPMTLKEEEGTAVFCSSWRTAEGLTK